MASGSVPIDMDGGWQRLRDHQSQQNGCDQQFSVHSILFSNEMGPFLHDRLQTVRSLRYTR